MDFGLSEYELTLIKNTLSTNKHVEEAVLFGSRAMGTYSRSSDIDIMLIGDALLSSDEAQLMGEMKELNIPYDVDLIRQKTITSIELKKHIKVHGQSIYKNQTRKEKPSIEWKKVELGEIAKYITEKVLVSTLNINNYFSTENMLPNKGGVTTATALPLANYVTKVNAGDVLISNIRPYFKKIWLAKKDSGCSNDVICFRAKTGIDSKYLYYILNNDNFFDYVMLGSKGTKMPRGDKSQIMKYPIDLPPIEEQKRIAEILSSFDDKIENNRAMCQTLEAMAQALFKSWFIDFEFPNEHGKPYKSSGGSLIDSPLGPIPHGWRIDTLGNIISLKKNPVKSENNLLPYLPIDLIPMNSLGITRFDSPENAKSSLILFEKDDILIGAMRVYFHRVVLSPCIGVTRTTCFVLTPKSNIFREYSLLLCNCDTSINYAQNTSSGTTMPYAVWDNVFSNMPVIIPPENILNNFSKVTYSIINAIRDSFQETQTLSELRDNLLSHLMSNKNMSHQ